jgi:hypothetical protein
MNLFIRQHFDTIEVRLIESPVHCESEVVQEIINIPDVFSIIEEIEAALKKS